MIYNDTYFKEQLKKTYIERQKGSVGLLFYIVLIALITLIVHNFFYTMNETIIARKFSYLTKYSFYSMLSIYNNVIIVYFIIIYIIKYKRLTIAEIKTNKWYLLIKNGHSISRLVFSKLLANILSVLITYTLAFILLLFIGFIMQLQLNVGYLFPLAILGLIQLFFIVFFIMSISVFENKRGNCLLYVVISIIFMFKLSHITNFNVSMLQNASYLLSGKTSIYMYVLIVLIISMLIFVWYKSLVLAVYYSPKAQVGENIHYINYTNNASKILRLKDNSKGSLYQYFLKATLLFIVFTSIVANIGIILLATFNNQNFVFKDYVTYTFKSNTMEDEINKNDFVWFKKITNDKLDVDDIVMYYQNNEVIVQLIEEVNEDGSYLVDYINYPSDVLENSYSKKIDYTDIVAVYRGKSAILGAFLVWNQAISSKVLTLIIPSIILLFYSKFENIFKKMISSNQIDETDDTIVYSEKQKKGL